MESGPSPYADLDRPPLHAGDLTRALRAAAGRWEEVRVVASTGSTNADLAADPGLRDGLVLVAEHQSAGRGRLDRAWSSPPRAGLTFSVAVGPLWPRTSWGWVPLVAGAALAEVAREDCGLAAARSKWPNDLLIDGRKAAGILAQSVESTVIVGVGLNVTTRTDELPTSESTSLRLSHSTLLDRRTLLVGFLRRFDHLMLLDVEAARERVLASMGTIGTHVRVELPDGEVVEGTGVDVDHDGRLVVDTGSGSRVFAAGDVRHLRRA